ncbi:hypothetical protein B5F79_08650 [Olsenella sp. An285]|uniref:DnaB-like helicase C-terminal domain-containing protein n=1 Tax=Olsenella sp. An285 TaxID=1965621 RepID=UPI000B3A71DB|nr:DnaB-like helicase C-terminal domain-containing protein [Olsenella sp. An285]OUO46006.1 hypothetical protein B5F79_08650 [Olsenella sp. An285]
MGKNDAWEEFSARFGSYETDALAFADPPRVVPTGIASLDALLVDGMAPGVHVLMAQPGAGKSALALQVSMNVARAGGNVLYCSLEMTRQQCLARCCSSIAKAEPGIKDFYWSGWERMGRQAQREASRYRFPDDLVRLEFLSTRPAVMALRALRANCPGLAFADDREVDGIAELSQAAREASDAGLDLLVVDYLQRLRPPESAREGDRYRQVTEVSNALAALTKALRVPALVISSMNREAMNSDRPSIGGARGSGDIEYDAVTLWQLRRGGGPTLDDGSRIVELHLTKNRRGPVTDDCEPIRLLFDGRHNSFSECP